MDKTKQTNMRLDEKTVDAFRHYCEEKGLSHAEGFNQFMDYLRLSTAQEIMPGQATDIKNFQMHANALVSAYLCALDVTRDTESRMHEVFSSALDSKDKIILNLQAQVSEAEKKTAAAVSEQKKAEESALKAAQLAAQTRSELEAAQEDTDNTRQLNQLLTKDLKAAEIKLLDYDRLKAEENTWKEELAETRRKFDNVSLELKCLKETLKNQQSLENAVKQLQEEFAKQSKLLQLERTGE